MQNCKRWPGSNRSDEKWKIRYNYIPLDNINSQGILKNVFPFEQILKFKIKVSLLKYMYNKSITYYYIIRKYSKQLKFLKISQDIIIQIIRYFTRE